MEAILTPEERELLLAILKQHQTELLRELSRASHHHFKGVLKQQEQLLESIIHKLEMSQTVLTVA